MHREYGGPHIHTVHKNPTEQFGRLFSAVIFCCFTKHFFSFFFLFFLATWCCDKKPRHVCSAVHGNTYSAWYSTVCFFCIKCFIKLVSLFKYLGKTFTTSLQKLNWCFFFQSHQYFRTWMSHGPDIYHQWTIYTTTTLSQSHTEKHSFWTCSGGKKQYNVQ